MYKHECFKIFSRKSIYVVFTFIVLFMYYGDVRYGTDWVMKEDVYEELSETWGGPITEDKEARAREAMRVADERESSGKQTVAERAAGDVHYLVAVAAMNSDQLADRKEALKGELSSLHPDSYEYKEVTKELNMLQQLGDPYGFYIIQGWNGMFRLIEPLFSGILLSILILLGLTPVFADEHTQRMNGLILSTKHGKRKLVTAKMTASLTYLFAVFMSLHIVNGVFQFINYGQFKGGNAPIQNMYTGPGAMFTLFEDSPFPFDVWQFLAITLSVQFVACVALGLLVLFLSLATKNSMVAFFISGAVLGVPLVMRQLGMEQGLLKYITSFNYVDFIRVERLFNEFNAFNVFGYPVLYHQMIFILFSIITTIVIILTYHKHQNMQVN